MGRGQQYIVSVRVRMQYNAPDIHALQGSPPGVTRRIQPTRNSTVRLQPLSCVRCMGQLTEDAVCGEVGDGDDRGRGTEELYTAGVISWRGYYGHHW